MIGIMRFSREKRDITLSSINVKKGAFNLYQDSIGDLNSDFFFDAIKNWDTTRISFLVNINKIKSDDLTFRFISEDTDTVLPGINFNHLIIDIQGFLGSEFTKDRNGKISFRIHEMGFIENCGFQVESLEGNMTISDTTIRLEDAIIYTPQSNLYLQYFAFVYDHYQSFRDGGIINDVETLCNLEDSDISTKDLYLLADIFKDYNEVFKVSANIGGNIGNLRAENLNIRHGEDIQFLGSVDIDGLPNTKEIFIFSEIERFSLSQKSLTKANINQLFKKNIQLPNTLENLGLVSYTGFFTGFLDDFVAYGDISSDMGILSTDVAIKPDPLRNIHINGSVSCINFQLGKFTKTPETLGDISLDISINGVYKKDKTLAMETEGSVHKFQFNNYLIHDIQMRGDITHEHFDGLIAIKDPNIDIDFNGLINYTEKLPSFDFNATINHANLFHLNLDQSDSSSSFGSSVSANFHYDERNIFKGRVKIEDGLFVKTDKQLILDEILLYTIEGDINQIILKSDYMDGRIVGKYDFQILSEEFQNFLALHLPGIHQKSTIDTNHLNNFQFDFYIKNAGALSSYFNPDYFIAPNAVIKGVFSASTQTFDMKCESNLIQIPDLQIENLQINILSFSDSIRSNINIGRISVMEKISEANIHINNLARHDSVFTTFSINSIDSTLTRGALKSLLTINEQNSHQSSPYKIDLYPTQIIIGDTLFNINSGTVLFDSALIEVNHFNLQAKEKYIHINGNLSQNPDDRLNIMFNDIELSGLNTLIRNPKIKFEGMAKGNAFISDIWGHPYFGTNIEIDTLLLNGEALGYTKLESLWNNEDRLIRFNMQSLRNEYPILHFSGIYEPEERFIDASASLSKLRAHILNPFLNGTLSEIKGIANGEVTLIGPLSDINMNGYLIMQRTSFLVDYLNTRYSFTHEIPISNNDLQFNAVDVFDEKGNKGFLNGTIGFPKMQNVLLNLALRTEKLQVLNTSYADNPYFFGKAYASGVSTIQGDPNNIAMNISLKTMPNSDISIPVTTEGGIDEKRLVTFVQPEKKEEEKQPEKKEDFGGFDMTFDLEVTQDTRVQLLFDLDFIDVIRAAGGGNISMGINKSGQFEIFGEYEIDRGDFWLNLQNVINKKFSIKQGSKLTWNGDPVNADIDINALYKLKASLSNLFGDTTQMYKRRVPVECELAMSGVLTNPEIDFLINLPTVEPETRSRAEILLDTEEKRSRQFLSLLVFNSFWYEPDAGNAYASQQGGYTAFTASTGSELLSNQLSGWLSQFSSDVDIGVYYRPGSEHIGDEVELALSMQLLDEWVSISGNVDMTGEQGRQDMQESSSATGNIVGDVEVDVKVNKSGKLRVKAFHRANDDVWYRTHEYRQGVGITYREEFESLFSFLRRSTAKTEEEEEEEKNEHQINN